MLEGNPFLQSRAGGWRKKRPFIAKAREEEITARFYVYCEMKIRLLLLTVTLVVVAGLTATPAQSKRNRAAKEFMREKLELSQKALEGLALEDFDAIATKGRRLSAMTKEADWRIFENPDYDQQSILFRRQVDALTKAAKDKNLDAATLAYVRMTMSCVDCHKLVRGKLVAGGEGLPLATLVAYPQSGLSALSLPRNGEQSATWAQRIGWQSVNVTQVMNGRTMVIHQN